MDFDINMFKRNIEKHNVKRKNVADDQSGIVNVINHVWNGDYINEINFGSFSVKDAIYALEAMEGIALNHNDDGDESFLVDPRNPFMIFKQVDDSLYKLATSKNKVYESDEEEIFI